MKCGICGQQLKGVSKQSAQTKKRPERKFAGVLCHKCAETVVKMKSRLENGSITEDRIDLRYLKFVNQLK